MPTGISLLPVHGPDPHKGAEFHPDLAAGLIPEFEVRAGAPNAELTFNVEGKLAKVIACKHKIMGTAPGFIPETLDTSVYDEVVPITTEEAYDTTRFLARREGILAGISSGAAVAGMVKLARREEYRDKVLLAVLPDTGERYLSTELCNPGG